VRQSTKTGQLPDIWNFRSLRLNGLGMLAVASASRVLSCRLVVMSLLDGAEVQRLLADVAERAGRYLAGLDDRPVAPGGAALAGLARFDEPLPDSAGDAAATLALLDEAGSSATVASAGGRYFGFVTGGSHPVALGATLALVAAVQRDGTCWCGPTTWQHRPAMRISVSGWATSDDDIRKSAAAIIAAHRQGQDASS
jgi:hypothetical protein